MELSDTELISCAAVPESCAEDYRALLRDCGLRDEGDTEQTVLCRDGQGRLLACGSLRGSVLKQIAVSPQAEGEGLCAAVVTELLRLSADRGRTHLFLYTAPEHERLFSQLGFFPVVWSPDILMMENRSRGLERFLLSLPRFDGRVGAVVCNCNPFTLGHRHLIEVAAGACDELLVFVLSDERSFYPAELRYQMVRAGTADLENVHVYRGGDYIVSEATFPTYFIREEGRCREAACQLDVRLFAERLAPALNITVRFVGEEPRDPVTRAYNQLMKELLPEKGIRLVELPRYRGISASVVRGLIKEGRTEEAKALLPESVYDYCLCYPAGGAGAQRAAQ